MPGAERRSRAYNEPCDADRKLPYGILPGDWRAQAKAEQRVQAMQALPKSKREACGDWQQRTAESYLANILQYFLIFWRYNISGDKNSVNFDRLRSVKINIEREDMKNGFAE